MTEPSTKSYIIEKHCFNDIILKVFLLRTRLAKTSFEHELYVLWRLNFRSKKRSIKLF